MTDFNKMVQKGHHFYSFLCHLQIGFSVRVFDFPICDLRAAAVCNPVSTLQTQFVRTCEPTVGSHKK